MSTYKVLGRGELHFYDNNSYHDAIHYITNPAKAAYVGGSGIASLANAAEEMQQTSEHFHKNCGKRLRHSELSFSDSEHITPELAKQYADKIIQHYGSEYQIVYAVHQNTDHTHIHFVMNQVAYTDGHRYQGKKKDYHDFLNHIRHVTHLPVIPAK